MTLSPLVVLFSLCLCLLAAADEPDISASAAALHQRGIDRFFDGNLKQAVSDWDRAIALQPSRGPHHWQRGLALYYLGEYDKGAAQFLSHQRVNGHDVENAAWHFICVARRDNGSLDKARKQLIPIKGDTRIPMNEIHRFYAGELEADAVIAAARKSAEEPALRKHLCYAHLYLGLYYEALGETEKAKSHIRMAAIDYKMDDYMGKVAQLHHQLRSGKE